MKKFLLFAAAFILVSVLAQQATAQRCDLTMNDPPELLPGIITGTQTICSGFAPEQLNNVTSASGGTETLTYQWEFREDDEVGGWTAWSPVLSGDDQEDYQPGALILTTQFQRAVDDANGCGPVYSNEVTVTVFGYSGGDAVLVIDPDTGEILCGHAKIQAAVDAANPGDIIKIPGGVYVENVDDDKGVNFSPGTSPDCVTIVGNFTVTPTTTFDMDIWGETVCDDYDQFTVTGTLTITDATLNIILDGYVPNLGDQFIIFIYGGYLTGTFDDIVVDNPGVEFTIDYGSGSDDQIVLTTSGVPPAIPLANWALYLGILLMITFVVLRFMRMI